MVDVSIIMACFNGQNLMEPRVLEFETVLKGSRWSWEILLCDDGSTDGTAEVCYRLASQSGTRRFLSNPVNRGRGQTVRAAIPLCRGRFIGYVDVDQSTTAACIVPVLTALEENYDVAEANRTYQLRVASFPFIAHRYLAHKMYAQLVRRTLGISGHDTETGFKFFRRDAIHKLIETAHAARWFWETELIAEAHRLRFRVAEIPSVFIRTPRTPTTVHLFSDSLHQFQQLKDYANQHKGIRFAGPCCRY